MKLTKSKLKQIIKEEIKLLNEASHENEELDDSVEQTIEQTVGYHSVYLPSFVKWLQGELRKIYNNDDPSDDPGKFIEDGVAELQSLKHPFAKAAVKMLILNGRGPWKAISLLGNIWKDTMGREKQRQADKASGRETPETALNEEKNNEIS